MPDASAEFRDRLLRALKAALNGTVDDRVTLLNEVAHGVNHLAEFDQDTHDGRQP